ncbi:MAG: hypothetical protein NWP50_00160 [Schleiferiaceae bacterium]|nr:hypothetical protein [Schleiferiaceae bacterium]
MSRKGDILHVLATKSSNKQLVHRNALAVFADLKGILRETAAELNSQICAIDHSVVVEFVDRGEYEVEIRFSGDSLIFQVHSNAFALPEKHPLRQTPYVQADEKRAFFGLIHVYNFLSDSFKMRRMNDAGMLLSRFFVNGEGHYMAEGLGRLGMPLTETPITPEVMQTWVEHAMLQAMDMDLVVAPFNEIHEISVMELEGLREELRQRTSKRLGYRPTGGR